MIPRKADQSTMNGVGRGLKTAFAPDSPVDPELRALIRDLDGTYGPDVAADRRVNKLLDHIKSLPWDGR